MIPQSFSSRNEHLEKLSKELNEELIVKEEGKSNRFQLIKESRF